MRMVVKTHARVFASCAGDVLPVLGRKKSMRECTTHLPHLRTSYKHSSRVSLVFRHNQSAGADIRFAGLGRSRVLYTDIAR
jgi:hypothetical protein